MKKNRKKGFTLIEMVVVLVIIAILAGAGIPLISQYIADSRATARELTAETVNNGLVAFIASNNGTAPDAADLQLYVRGFRIAGEPDRRTGTGTQATDVATAAGAATAARNVVYFVDPNDNFNVTVVAVNVGGTVCTFDTVTGTFSHAPATATT
jgi:prepilin-type N-terminal cleavage/methylation domain-containing protein